MTEIGDEFALEVELAGQTVKKFKDAVVEMVVVLQVVEQAIHVPAALLLRVKEKGEG